MTVNEAYQILGIQPGTGQDEMKKKYRQLMLQVHPDMKEASGKRYRYNAKEINLAYALLKKNYTEEAAVFHGEKGHGAGKEKQDKWDAPVNEYAYMEREVFHYVEDREGEILGKVCIATGKYLWKTEEDFPLFLLSLYRCSKHLLDEIDSELCRSEIPALRGKFQTELTYLLAQQFIDAAALLKELAAAEAGQDGYEICYIPAMLECAVGELPLKKGEALYPSGVRRHKLYLRSSAGREVGYLSFADDRLYYIVVPLFEQKRVQVRIQVREDQPERRRRRNGQYLNLHLWIKLFSDNGSRLPENLNLQIGQLLEEYRMICINECHG